MPNAWKCCLLRICIWLSKNVIGTKPWKKCNKGITQHLKSFLLLTFFWTRINEFETSIKFCVFYKHNLIHIVLSQMRKKTFSSVLQKLKTNFLVTIYFSPIDSHRLKVLTVMIRWQRSEICAKNPKNSRFTKERTTFSMVLKEPVNEIFCLFDDTTWRVNRVLHQFGVDSAHIETTKNK